MILAVTWMPHVPQPKGNGISRLANGTWYPGMATAFRIAHRIKRLVSSSR